MRPDEAPSRNLIFWGAGATCELGIRTTAQQQHFIRNLVGDDGGRASLRDRVSIALKHNNSEPWPSAFTDFLTILGDTDSVYRSIDAISNGEIEAMRRNWRKGASADELRRRIIGLRLIYDWPALKSVVRLCPGGGTNALKLNDLFNLLDMHIQPGSGFRGPAPGARPAGADSQQQFLDVRRLIGAKNALYSVLLALFYVDYQRCIDTRGKVLRKYYDFATLLGRRMQRHGLDLASRHKLDDRLFYQGDVVFVSLNYDPIALWVGFNANRDLNHHPAVPHVGSPALPLHLFHDFGHLIPARRIARPFPGSWYPMNEAVTQRLNETRAGGEHRVRLTKFLFPHGCLCWRECPDCGKLSAYHGDDWGLDAHGLFPPPPLLAFDRRPVSTSVGGRERAQRENGAVDARACLHCDTLTYAHHTQAIMQSSFKPRPPSFIEEIERDLRATTMQADHIIFMGYSLPPDDVTYRAFLCARQQRDGVGPVRCTVVDKCDKNPGWYGPKELGTGTSHFDGPSPLQAAREIFGPENVRYYGGGIPEVFLDRGTANDARIHQLLTWS